MLRLASDLSVDQRDMFGLIYVVAVADDVELPIAGRDPGFGHPMDQLLGSKAVGHQLGDGDERQSVLSRELLQLRPAGHGAIGVENFTYDTGGNQTGKSGQIDARLSLPDPLKYAARPGAQWKYMSGTPQVGRYGGRIDGNVDRGGPVGGRNAGRDAEPALRRRCSR